MVDAADEVVLEECSENDAEGSEGSGNSESSDASDESEVDEESAEDEEDSSEESSDEPDSEDSVWEAFGETTEQTAEANEAVVLNEFQQALTFVVDGKRDKALKIFHRLLRHPLISPFHKVDIDWDEETDPRLSKMARIFVGVHKNLAKLEDGNVIDHYIQVLATAPHNSSTWLELGLKCVEQGDLDLSLFAFRKVDTVDCGEHIASVLYLSKQYHACLHQIKRISDSCKLNDKLLFLRERIRNMGTPYKEFCEEMFDENPLYDPVVNYRKRSWKELESRLIRVEENQRAKQTVDSSIFVSEAIDLEIDADYNFLHIATIFCDLFDRIESYSVLSSQVVRFAVWEDRSSLIHINELVTELVDLVEVTDDLVRQASRAADLTARFDLLRGSSAASRSRSASIISGINKTTVRRSARIPLLEEDNRSTHRQRSERETSVASTCSGHYNKLASFIGCSRENTIYPLRDGLCRPSRTPTPFFIPKQLDEELLIDRLRTNCVSKSLRIREVIETTLLGIASVCPDLGSLPVHMHQVTRQLYRRLNLMRSNMENEEWLALHVLMDELGETHARDYCVRWHLTKKWPSRDLGLRFAWNHAKLISDDNIKLDFLYILEDSLDDEEVVVTANGMFCKADIEVFIGKVEKKERIRSIKEHRESGNHQMVSDIMEKDIDLSSIEEEELSTMVGYWLDALCALGQCDKAIELLNRLTSHRLSTSSLDDEASLTDLLDWLDLILKTSSEVDVVSKSCDKWETAAYQLCQITSLQSSNQRLWITLYRIIKYIDGPLTIASLSHWSKEKQNNPEAIELGEDETMDSDEEEQDEDKMPTRALDVLCKAHEALAEANKCSPKKSDFLATYLGELSLLFTNTEIRQLMIKKEPSWLWANVQQEVAQTLGCAFGRYCKKRKNIEDHECSGDMSPTPQLAELAIPMAMPINMPLFDDKERLGHDVVELIQSRFAFLLDVDEKRSKREEAITDWLKTVDKEQLASCDWPHSTSESNMHSTVWYVMALHSYRQNIHSDTMRYSRLFLSSGHATRDNPVTVSAWAMLAHSSTCELFQLQEDEMFSEFQWRTMPFRVGLAVCDSIAILHFQLANALYQCATKLSRFIYQLATDDIRRRRLPSIRQMRVESQFHFEAALALAQPTPTSPIEEFQWLCYFFLAKLQSKHPESDIVKVVDYLFEAACSLELGDFFYYTIKISAKKQQNIEPVELHYQLHSAVWKYISRAESPEVDTLISLLSYVKAFQSHKVVRNNFSLFSRHPDVHESLIRMTVQVAVEEKENAAERIDEDKEVTASLGYSAQKDLMDELFNLCYKAFELVCDRFPHPKAHYRLAEMEMSRGKVNKAGEHILRGIFKRKKKDDGFLDGLVEITSTDIDRCGSLAFHVERSLRLALRVLSLQGDMSTLLHAVTAIVNAVGQGDEDHLRSRSYRPLLSLSLRALRPFITAAHLVKQSKAELVRLWTTLTKFDSCIDLRGFRQSLHDSLTAVIGDMDTFIRQQQVEAEVKKRQVRKRKMTSFDLARSQPSPPIGVAPPSDPSTYLQNHKSVPPAHSLPFPPSTSTAFSQDTQRAAAAVVAQSADSDIQIMEDPLVLMRIAMQAAGYGAFL